MYVVMEVKEGSLEGGPWGENESCAKRNQYSNSC